MADTHVLEVQQGVGEPSSVELRRGVEVSPLGVGAEGSWKVRGNGILGVHAYIYFDGNSLFVQSADDTNPVLVDGRAVAKSWTPISAPCTISLATVRLAYKPKLLDPIDNDKTMALVPQEFADDDRTIAAPPPVIKVGAKRPFEPGAFAQRNDESTRLEPMDEPVPDSEATRIVPLGETPASGAPAARPMMGRPAAVRPAAGARWGSGTAPQPPDSRPMGPTSPDFDPPATRNFQAPAPLMGMPTPSPMGFPPAGAGSAPAAPNRGPPSGLLNVPMPPPPPSVHAPTMEEKLKKEWASLTPPKKAMMLLMPLALPIAWFALGTNPPPATPSPVVATVASHATATVPPPVAPPPPTTPTFSLGSVPPAAPPIATKKPPVTPPDSQPDTPTPPAGTDRRERQAADFVSTGQYEQAARIYDQLAIERASANPNQNPYHEAARILRAKVDAGIR